MCKHYTSKLLKSGTPILIMIHDLSPVPASTGTRIGIADPLLDLRETFDDQISSIKKNVEGCNKAPLFFMCSKGFHVFYKSCNQYRVCTRCARKRYLVVQRKLLDPLTSLLKGRGSRTNLRLMTLTQENFKDPNKGIDYIHESFKRLKQRKWWKKRVYSYVAAVEPKLQNNGLWHVHIHIVANMVFIGKTDLSTNWRTATGGVGYIVDISGSVTNVFGAVNHLMNYVTKRAGANLNQYLIQAMMKGRRLLLTGGQFHAHHKNSLMIKKSPLLCKCCGSTFQWIHFSDYYLYDWITAWFENKDPGNVSGGHKQDLNKWIE